ncbi:MAG: hypothetical protein LVQ94_03200 [Thermoplasmatales archaeon]|nr:hypothetical protein [Thermoplasmatales archaeon]
MDYYAYFWDLLKYYIPVILLILSLVVFKSILLLIISIVWILASVFVSISEMEPRKGNFV